MPLLAMEVLPPWLAGVFLGAPMAAIMSTVNSLLLLVSSSIIKDIYVNYINKDQDEQYDKKGSLWITGIVGLLVLCVQLNHQIFNMAKFIFFRWIRSGIHLANRIRVILEERKCYRSACVYFSWGRLIYVYSSFLSKSVRYTYSCLPDLFCVYRLHHWKYECCKNSIG